MALTLSTNNHRSDIVGLTYVYPVLSRRAGGLSIGINFNVNNACNWRCIYCQVPNLKIGSAPTLDFLLLEQELRGFLSQVFSGEFYQQFQVDAERQVIKDIAIAGNGEPTSLKEFSQAVDLIGKIAVELGVFPASRYILITNGSLVHQQRVQQGLRKLNDYNGEIWFKFDSADNASRKLINNAAQSCDAAIKNMAIAAELCNTKIQTCVFNYQQQSWSPQQLEAYLSALREIKNRTAICEVMIYSLARPSAQPEASDLEKCSEDQLNNLADCVKQLGYKVSVSY